MATDVLTAWEEFGKKYPEEAFDRNTLTASTRPGSYELAMSYGGDVARLNRNHALRICDKTNGRG